MSTPLVDAKKIPTEKKTSVELCLRQKVNLNTAATTTTITTNGTKYQISLCKPPTTGIMIPSSSMIGKNLDTRISSDQASTNKINFNIVGKISDVGVTPLTSLPAKTMGKIRTRMSTALHCSKKSNINEIVEVPDLPNIALPIDRLPTFNFTTVSEASKESSQTKENEGIQFKFSSPIQHNAPPTPQIPSSEMCFTFSSPVNKESDTTENSSQSEKLGQEGDLSHEKYPDTDEIISSVQKDKEKVTEKKQIQSLGFDEKFKPPVGSWECSCCLVRNLENAIKCIACESPKSNLVISTSEISGYSDIKMDCNKNSKATDRSLNSEEEKDESKNSFSNSPLKINTISSAAAAAAITATTSTTMIVSTIITTTTTATTTATWQDFGDKFKPPPGNWTCPTCLISNDEMTSNCLACETSNPQHKPSIVEQVPLTSFGAKFKPPPGSWECDTCFVQNSSDAVKCIACETSRCVASKPSDSAQMFSGFKFGNSEKQNTAFNNNNSGFKFGITTTSGLSKNSEPNEFTFGSKISDSRPLEGFKFNASNFAASSSAFTFGGKSLQTNSESKNTADGKSQFGITHNVENPQITGFGNKVLPASFESNKSPQQLFGSPSTIPKSETSNYALSKTAISQTPSIAITVTSNAPMTSDTATVPTSLNTTTTTASIFNFGKPQPIVSANTASSQRNNLEDTNALVNPSTSSTFSFTSPQKIIDVSKSGNAAPDKVETNSENIENATTTSISQKPIAAFSFGSGTQGTTISTNSVFKATTPSNIFTFGAPVSFPIVSTQQNVINAPKNPFTPNTTSQVSFSNFGNKLSTTTFTHDNNQQKQGFGFSSLPEVQFSTSKSLPSSNVFRFGTLQDQKPAENAKSSFTFGASQEQKTSGGEQAQKAPFSFNFQTAQNEQKTQTLSQDNCFNFSAAKGNDREKPKSGFNFSFNSSPNVFGTPSTSAPASNFNFAGNVASSGSPFSFTATSSGPSQSTRKIKRAVRRSALGPGRREN